MDFRNNKRKSEGVGSRRCSTCPIIAQKGYLLYTFFAFAGDVADSVLIMANAIYFKGTWRRHFLKNLTATRDFYVSPHQTVQVPYMSTSGQFYFTNSRNLDAKILRIPYKVSIHK